MTIADANQALIWFKGFGYQAEYIDQATAAWRFKLTDPKTDRSTVVLLPFAATDKQLRELSVKFTQYFKFFRDQSGAQE